MTVTVSNVYDFINELAPFESALPYDNVGLIVGDKAATVHKIGVCLDITADSIEKAVMLGCNVLVSHHPFIFEPIKSIMSDDVAFLLIKNGISAISAHSNLDAANGGVNDCLCDCLNITDTQMLSDKAYPDYPPIARIGKISSTMSAEDFAEFVKVQLNSPDVRYCSLGKPIQKVAVCSGAGSDLMIEAYKAGADAFVTSELKHHEWLIANTLSLTVLDAGHFSTENVVVFPLSQKIKNKFDIKVEIIPQHAPYRAI